VNALVTSKGFIGIAWALVSIPLLYGLVETAIRVSRLFTQ